MSAAEPQLADGPVTLRPLTKDDVGPRYLGWLNDPEVNRWLETRWTKQDEATIRNYLVRQDAAGAHLWAIMVGGKHIGNIKLGPVDGAHSHADVSYFIGERSEWGKGHATRAVNLVVSFAWKKGIHRVQAGAYERNIASHRVLKKAGFALEGRLHRALKTENGWCDHFLFGRVHDQVSL